MFKRPLALAAGTLYVSTMIGLVGGIGVMASSTPSLPAGSGYEVGFALIMLLSQ